MNTNSDYFGNVLINGHSMVWHITTETRKRLFRVKKRIRLARISKDGKVTAEFINGKKTVEPDHDDEETHICFACALEKTDCNTHNARSLFRNIYDRKNSPFYNNTPLNEDN